MNILDIRTLPLEGTHLVEASAGTGKTFTIGLIVLRLILEDRLRGMESLAVVTFTEAATGELAERIGRFVADAREAADNRVVKDDAISGLVQHAVQISGKDTIIQRLDRALLDLDRAGIATINGFCQRILTEFAFETKSAFGTEMLASQQDLVHEILADFWRREIAVLDERLLPLASGLTPEDLAKAFREMLAFPGLAAIGPVVDVNEWFSFPDEFAELGGMWKDSREEIAQMLSEAPKRFHQSSYPLGRIPEFIESADESFSNGTVSADTLRLFTRERLEKKLNKGSYVLPALQLFDRLESFLDRREAFGVNFKASLKTRAWKYLSAELIVRKHTRRLRSFSDQIEDLAKSLNPATAAQIRARYSAVLVDEFQDTDPLQYGIFATLFADRPDIFFAMIGDPKQAIYRFRGGDIDTYLAARAAVAKTHRHTLASNFRSQKRFIAALNGIYGSFVNPSSPSGPFLNSRISYETVTAQKEYLPPSYRNTPDVAAVPVTLFAFPDKEKSRIGIWAPRVADTIARLVDPGNPMMIGEATSRRALRPGDMAVLVNSHRTGRQIREYLAGRGIRAVSGKGESVLSSDEGEVCFLLLSVLLRQSDEKALRALMLSPLYGFDISDLDAWEIDDRQRCATLAGLSQTADTWKEKGISVALEMYLSGRGVYRGSVDAGAQGLARERVITNWRHLTEILHAEELRLGRIPERLLSRFTVIWSDNTTEAYEQRLESDADAVKIVTMHKSKGLQWPVVFAVELTSSGKGPNNASPAPLVADPDSAIPKRIADFFPDHQKDIKRKIIGDPEGSFDSEIEQERMRVAYVTLTRAEHLLYVVTADLSEIKKVGPRPDRTPAALLLRNPAFAELKDAQGCLVEEVDLSLSVDPRPFVGTDAGAGTGSARAWNRSRSTASRWRIGSYSGLTRTISHTRTPRAPDSRKPEGIFAFPKGAEAGTALHTIFEKIDFIKSSAADYRNSPDFTEKIGMILDEAGFGAARYPDRITQVLSMVDSVLHAPVIPGSSFHLGQLHSDAMVSELGFHLTAAHPESKRPPLTAGRLVEAVGETTGHISGSSDLSGFLTGFIDLVFQHEGKWFILDWKSNHLGNAAECYSRAAMETAMVEHNYHLQYHIYTAALCRYLRVAGTREFSWERDFGGVVYLFLRGVDGNGNGVYFVKPDEAVIAKLDGIL